MDDTLWDALQRLVRNTAPDPSLVAAIQQALPSWIPADYWEVMRKMNGAEGFIGATYVRLYPLEKLGPLNQAFGTETFLPGAVIFGSNGGGEAFAFMELNHRGVAVQVPFIPLDRAFLLTRGATFASFLASLWVEHAERVDLNVELLGREIHEIQPVIFGGSPTDPQNKVLLLPEQYAEYVLWWNHKYRELRATR